MVLKKKRARSAGNPRKATHKPTPSLPIRTWKAASDVVVIGGGSAGVSASIAAARLGKSVTLVEWYPFLGGTATAAMVVPVATFHTLKGRQVVGGIPDEIVQELVRNGGSLGHVPDTIGVCGTLTPIEPEIMKLTLLEFAKKAGVNILFHALVHGVEQRNGRIVSIHALTKGGPVSINGKVYIDASGDADVAAAAGVPFSVGQAGTRPMPMTLVFKVGNVKFHETVNYMLSHREEFYDKTRFNELESAPCIGVSGFYSLWREAIERGEITNIPRDRVLFFSGVRKGEATVNTTRVLQEDPLNPWKRSRSEEEGRRQVSQLMRFFRKRIPGFEDCVLVQVATQIGIRESRRIHGESTLTAEDVLLGRHFDDEIAQCAWPVDIHDPHGKGIVLKDVGGNGSYGIPYPCLIPKDIENLLMAGRCISATQEAAASARIGASAMAYGQAAGTAAAMSLKYAGEVRKVSVSQLREQLLKHGAIL